MSAKDICEMVEWKYRYISKATINVFNRTCSLYFLKYRENLSLLKLKRDGCFEANMEKQTKHFIFLKTEMFHEPFEEGFHRFKSKSTGFTEYKHPLKGF